MSRRRRRTSGVRRDQRWMTATQPGIGRLLADDLRAHGIHVEGIESDGRSDLVIFPSAEPPPEEALVLAEDLFIIVGDAPAASSADAVAARLFDAARWQHAADIARSFGARIGATTGYRVIVRVRSERHFKRTDVRTAVAGAVQRWRPRWRFRDPADLEVWVLETRREHFRAAMRLSSAEMRSHGGRAVERPGALGPSVAAALVRCAGLPAGRLLDPFCGSGQC
jgi:23S rRNA G2445 N2-methylase RlmL